MEYLWLFPVILLTFFCFFDEKEDDQEELKAEIRSLKETVLKQGSCTCKASTVMENEKESQLEEDQ